MMSSRKRICLVNFRLSGHHPLFLSQFTQAFQSIGCNVDIYSPDIPKCKEELLLAMPGLSFTNIKLMHTDSSTHNQKRKLGCRSFFNLLSLQREIEQQEQAQGFVYDLVFFAFLDDVVHADFKLPYLFKTPFTKKFSGLLMAPRDRTLKSNNVVHNLLTTSLLERKDAHFTDIGLLVEDVKAEFEKKINSKTVLYPDFCSEMLEENVESSIGKDLAEQKKGRTVTGLFGSIFSHKSVDLLLKCLDNADPTVHFFVVAGKFQWRSFSDEQRKLIEQAIENPPENLLIYDGWIESEAVFDSIFQMCDVIFAYYRGFKKSSNILTKSAFYKIPVIVSDKHLMGKRVRDYKLGYSLSEADVPELYKGLVWKDYEFDDTLLQDFSYQHSVKRLPEIFTNLLKLD